MTTATLPAVLIAAARDRSLQGALLGGEYSVTQVSTGALALDHARRVPPDVVLLDAHLPDMSGVELCRLLYHELPLGGGVPVLILTLDQPTPDQRVAALHAGAWDFIRVPTDPEELTLKLRMYVQAKRNIDAAIGDGLVDPRSGLHTRPGLARRARELGALMARTHGALACVVFAVEASAAPTGAGKVVARAARVSDVVGALDATSFAVLAPGTNDAGAVQLARRLGSALRETRVDGVVLAPGSTLLAGYDAVGNLTYSSLDPVELLARATAAVHHGLQESAHPWVRRFDPAGPPSGPTPAVLVLDKRTGSV